ncbi:MAG: ornithine cyclodeaminase family protein [Candidatus Saccharicenans sp.]|nr:ornithine cyclodeaminase family protein [Candidatus Saccharicenans sp.]
MEARLYFEPEIKGLVNLKEAIKAVEDSFAAYSSGRAVLPGVINLDLTAFQGEVHVKAAYIEGDEYYVIKTASGFYRNPELGLPVGNGLMQVFEARTGQLAAILFDRGYLTELRTAAAGAVAARYLAKNEIKKVAVIGSGVQARFQLRALAEVRNFREVAVWSRRPENVRSYIQEMTPVFPGVVFLQAESAEVAVREADLVITATPSRQPIIRAEWLKPGAHLTAMGSDGPEKQELYPEVLARADRLFCDSMEQCRRLGEVHHALEAGLISENSISGEIGELVLGRKPGRQSDGEITVADLTGLGAQDAAVASLFLRLASKSGVGGQKLTL